MPEDEYSGTAKLEIEVVQEHASVSDERVIDVGTSIDVTGDVSVRLLDVEPGDLWIRRQQEELGEWHSAAIPHATPLTQAAHLAVEASEVLDDVNKLAEYEGRLSSEEFADEMGNITVEIGDVFVTLLTFCELLGVDAARCLLLAREKNDERDWEERTSGGGWRE